MGLRQLTGVTCVDCGRGFGSRPQATCPGCGAAASLEPTWDYEEVGRTLDRASLDRREPWMWRYRELLPIDELADLPPLQVGMSPVYGTPRLAQWAGLQGLWLKDEGRNPSGSLEDRGAAVALVLAGESGRRVVATASLGPAGTALACFAAAMGTRAALFLPEDAEPGVAAAAFGAEIFRVRGGLEEAVATCHAACERFRWFDVQGPSAPFVGEGKKTLGLEIGEQLCERMPDWVVVAVGDGTALAATYKGLQEMKGLGLSRELPKMLGVQVEGAAPVYRAWTEGAPLVAERHPRGAAPLLVGNPRTWQRALAAVRASEGAMVEVGAQRVAEAAVETARRAAVLAGPAGAAAVAGLKQAVEGGVIAPGQTALVVVSDGGPTRPPAGSGVVATVLELGDQAGLESEVSRRGLAR